MHDSVDFDTLSFLHSFLHALFAKLCTLSINGIIHLGDRLGGRLGLGRHRAAIRKFENDCGKFRADIHKFDNDNAFEIHPHV